MTKKDIYKIDNYFITFGVILFLFGAIRPVGTEVSIVQIVMVTSAGVMLVVGIFYRIEEKKIIRIWNALDQAGEAKVNDMAFALGLKREFILEHLKEINRQQAAYYVWDEASDKIVNGKLMMEFIVVANCPNCGNKIDERISIESANPPKCQYCGTVVSSPEGLNQLKRDLLLKQQAAVVVAPPEFSVGIFVLLLVFFWPGAIYYAVKKYRK